ncbi:hypothetical protein [Streptomyces sp. NPDC051098]|uniref:hypothetical protein n=1 Tax=Streptomyces sp. NPDC051098 TaxID=3155411 RepID=UPI0034365115
MRESLLRSCLVLAWVGGACFLIGAASGVASLVLASSSSPYTVEFSRPEETCDKDAGITLSRTTGERLRCSELPPHPNAPDDTGEFSEQEVTEVTDLSSSLARDGGLNASDQRTVERKVKDISRDNGYEVPESSLEHMTATVGGYGLVGGLGLIVIGVGGAMVGLQVETVAMERKGRQAAPVELAVLAVPPETAPGVIDSVARRCLAENHDEGEFDDRIMAFYEQLRAEYPEFLPYSEKPRPPWLSAPLSVGTDHVVILMSGAMSAVPARLRVHELAEDHGLKVVDAADLTSGFRQPEEPSTG